MGFTTFLQTLSAWSYCKVVVVFQEGEKTFFNDELVFKYDNFKSSEKLEGSVSFYHEFQF